MSRASLQSQDFLKGGMTQQAAEPAVHIWKLWNIFTFLNEMPQNVHTQWYIHISMYTELYSAMMRRIHMDVINCE